MDAVVVTSNEGHQGRTDALRGSSVEERRDHGPEDAGSTPAPAIEFEF